MYMSTHLPMYVFTSQIPTIFISQAGIEPLTVRLMDGQKMLLEKLKKKAQWVDSDAGSYWAETLFPNIDVCERMGIHAAGIREQEGSTGVLLLTIL